MTCQDSKMQIGSMASKERKPALKLAKKPAVWMKSDCWLIRCFPSSGTKSRPIRSGWAPCHHLSPGFRANSSPRIRPENPRTADLVANHPV